MTRMKVMLLATALMIAAAQSNDPFRTPRRNTGVRRNDNQRKPKPVVGRMVLPKRAYRVIKIDERRGQYLSGKDLEEGKVRKFHIEQIIEVL